MIHNDLYSLNATIQDLSAKILLPKDWMEEWRQPIATFTGAIVGSAVTFFWQKYLHKRKEQKEEKAERNMQFSKINATLVALESTRIEILAYKGQTLNRYRNDAIEVKEEEQKNNEEALIKFCNNGQKIPTFFENFLPSITMDEFSYGETLNFIVVKPYLVTFYRLLGELEAIKEQNELRNKFVEFLKISDFKEAGWSLKTIDRVKLVIAQHTSSAKNLDMLTNSALAYIVLCKKYLNDYAANFYLKRNCKTSN